VNDAGDMATTKSVLTKLLEQPNLSADQALLAAQALDHLNAGRKKEAADLLSALTGR